MMMKQLRENDYINMDTGSYITTPLKVLKSLKNSMNATSFSSVLMDLGVDEETTSKNACKIEHDLSETSFEMIKRYYLKHRKFRHNNGFEQFVVWSVPPGALLLDSRENPPRSHHERKFRSAGI